MTKISKLNLLLKSNQKLFHTQDLALLWGITNRGTLYTSIKRLVKNGVLISIIKGLYSTVPVNEINKFQLGTALIHKFCYVSCETVLAIEGVINQTVYPITFVSSISLKIEYNGTVYLYRKLKPEILLRPDGVEKQDGYFIATKTRAISDMLYLNPKYYFDNLKK
ncbi:MAG: hypothetical protein AAB546_01770 [Patescibacteria group bacterium]